MNYFDKKNDRLVVIEQAATPDFWDAHWQHAHLARDIKRGVHNGMIRRFTSRFLSPPAKVIDAGCSIGQNVYGLAAWGYDAQGVDYAALTIKKTKEEFPDLNISVQDVRSLAFPDNFFDGYWSLGVIEHFEQGYSGIITEAHRVLKSGGYLFLSVPWFSPLRRLKAKLKRYPPFTEQTDMKQFYEFMLSDKEVIKTITAQGFDLIQRRPYDAVKGIKDEVGFLAPLLRWIYNGRAVVFKAVRFLVTLLFARFAGHIIVLVFQKK